MVWLTLAFGLIAIISVIIIFIYRKQIQSIHESLQFIEEKNSNMLITSELSYKDVTILVEDLNNLLEKHRLIERDYHIKDVRLKELITNLSHDIRTPLTSLDGYFQLLLASESKEERDRYYEVIRGRIECLKELLEELFLFMKLQNDSYILDRKKIVINKILYDTLFEFYEDFSKAGVEPNIEIPDEPISLLMNELAFKRILQNMIKNVIQHGQNKFRLQVIKEEKEVTFLFSNSYEAAKAVDVQRVFERFYRGDDARTKTSTGLGLSIAKELVEKMDGTISARVEEESFVIEIKFKS